MGFVADVGGPSDATARAAWEIWRAGHNKAYFADMSRLHRDLDRARSLSATEARLDGHGRRQLKVDEVALQSQNWPSALSIGVPVPGPHGPSKIRDVNQVFIVSRPWGFVYRLEDGRVMIERDPVSYGYAPEAPCVGSDISMYPRPNVETSVRPVALAPLVDVNQMPCYAQLTYVGQRAHLGSFAPGGGMILTPRVNELEYFFDNPGSA